jgi:hypothetical protein
MSKELKMKVFSTLALAISMAWGMPYCQADCGKSSLPSAESAQPCGEPLPRAEEFPYEAESNEPYELNHPYDYMPVVCSMQIKMTYGVFILARL